MRSAEIPKNESERIAALKRYNILDTPPEVAFEDIVKLASYICKTPISQVSLVDNNRLFYKANLGSDMTEGPREISFCPHAILADSFLEIEDASKDDRFFDNPLVTGEHHVRYYAGMPLKSSDGFNIGTLCVLDTKPRKLTNEQKEAIKKLARKVVSELELRLQYQILKEKEIELKKLNEFKDKLLSIISHDIRAPLNSIKATLQLLVNDQLTVLELKGLNMQLTAQVTNTLDMLENLLRWSETKLSNGTQMDSFTSNEIVLDTISLFTAEASKKGVKIINFDTNVPLYGDSEMIKIAIRNLVNNAVKYCRNGDSIEVGSKTSNEQSVIWVKDTGVGMRPEQLENVLNNRFLTSSVGTAGERGIGLGLILITEFIAANNGRIMASSTPGIGTEFRITLPIE
ncbi:MAG TPA: GAF domain-containing sensor histidine kinase [Fulvivirga sp.]|nr:GAF domain-containing sensor histidine kinase [Fulvivirga sp.]